MLRSSGRIGIEGSRRPVSGPQFGQASAPPLAERTVADASTEVDRLRAEADELRTLIESKTSAFVEIAQAALVQLDQLEAARPAAPAPARDAAELLSDLSLIEAAATGPAGERSPSPTPPHSRARPRERRTLLHARRSP
jgi:hypothetical protein